MSNTSGRHPEDLSPYLDDELSDPGYETIRLHVGECPACAEEVENWNSWQAMFRAPEAEIEVPESQWRRIMARIEEREAKQSFWNRFLGFAKPVRYAWGTAGALVLSVGMLISGLEYRDYSEGKKQLSALSAYSEAEQHWIARADNPFRSQNSMDNPFRRTDSTNANIINRQ
jgi:hypothetical protein